ncbi:hypothetical protein [Rhizobium azibense]|uniref:Uncharacterized protein n=1 Tax=Rhizobium azibense TaxID=1136135 RepID=A0A4R3RP51_9HYPH|nr:hypothetical protein [Rhizobium azibense]TCU37708.1 hypothetical protein EV129_10524 [Rhizobium azibense]
MNFVDLVLTVCTSADPISCRTENLHSECRGLFAQCSDLGAGSDRKVVGKPSVTEVLS